MTRQGREPAEDMKRRLVAACQEVGLGACRASMHLHHEAAARVILVDASTEHWKNELPLLSVMAIIPVSGDWPEFVDVRCSAGEDDLAMLNAPTMQGRAQVPLARLIDALRETLRERDEVIAAVKSGIPGPYRFKESVWRTIDLLDFHRSDDVPF